MRSERTWAGSEHGFTTERPARCPGTCTCSGACQDVLPQTNGVHCLHWYCLIRLAGRQASVLGCLAALSEAGRVLLDWERDSGSGAAAAGAAAVGRELQRKMARRVQEAHALLAVGGVPRGA